MDPDADAALWPLADSTVGELELGELELGDLEWLDNQWDPEILVPTPARAENAPEPVADSLRFKHLIGVPDEVVAPEIDKSGLDLQGEIHSKGDEERHEHTVIDLTTPTPERSVSPAILDYLEDQPTPASQQSPLNHVSTGYTLTVEVPCSTLTEPRSRFDGFIPSAPETTEAHAVRCLLEAFRSQPQTEADQSQTEGDHIEFELYDFAIYIISQTYPYEMRPLQHHSNTSQGDRFYFDGYLCVGQTRYYLKEIPFRHLPIGNYGSSFHSVGDQIWIRSDLNEKKNNDIYYKLKKPATEYARFHTPFLWIADLAKHVIDYCDYLKERGSHASLYDFKSNFAVWVEQTHRGCKAFTQWYKANGGTDFRTAIIANVNYIWKEACGLDPRSTAWHTIWKEIKTFERYKPNLGTREGLLDLDDEFDPQAESGVKRSGNIKDLQQTAVTPFVYELFSHMSFGSVLQSVPISQEVERHQSAHKAQARMRGRSQDRIPNAVKRGDDSRESFISSIQCGDVISTLPDDAAQTNTGWTLEKSKHHDHSHIWYGLVQRVHSNARSTKSFDVLWLSEPRDTPCGKMKYPWKNELFLSDLCTCHSGMARVKDREILSTHSVEWFGTPSTSAEFFVRQIYSYDYHHFASLEMSHLRCGPHDTTTRKEDSFKRGDFVLVEWPRRSLELKPFKIEAFSSSGEKQFAQLRRLPRRRDVDASASKSPVNELVYSDELVEIETKHIERHCLVRIFRTDEEITTPYNRRGTYDAFYITHQAVETEHDKIVCVPARPELLSSSRQGYNSNTTPKSQKMRGLDLFCGGGNFGRGLEDGGAVEMNWANDISTKAIHTYMANCEPGVCTPYLGSVDDLLLRALKGDKKAPRPGEVQFISGGSPCPGFSLLTQDKTTPKQKKNQSLVASFASFIDLYRPHYGLLENVPQMVRPRSDREKCVFSQLISTIVGLGYQTQVAFIDAWTFGTPQSRSRVFLCFTAPGFRMPRIPAPSHSHPPDTKLNGYGYLSNGQRISRRQIVATSHKFQSAGEAVTDLPDIQDAKADYCVGFPDHRLSIGYTPQKRKQISHIPTQPWGMNFSKAYYGHKGQAGEEHKPRSGVMLESTRQLLFPPEGKERVKIIARGWGRVNPNDLFSTVTTICHPSDARLGHSSHWKQPRPLTILEARRAQGFLDHEVILGSLQNQFRIVGNSVARQVALALGLAIREAWFGTMVDEKMTAADPCLETSIPDEAPFSFIQPMFSTPDPLISSSVEPDLYNTEKQPIILDSGSSDDDDGGQGSDELRRRGLNLVERLSKTPTASESSGSITAGNSHKRPSSSLRVETATKKPRVDFENGTAMI